MLCPFGSISGKADSDYAFVESVEMGFSLYSFFFVISKCILQLIVGVVSPFFFF